MVAGVQKEGHAGACPSFWYARLDSNQWPTESECSGGQPGKRWGPAVLWDLDRFTGNYRKSPEALRRKASGNFCGSSQIAVCATHSGSADSWHQYKNFQEIEDRVIGGITFKGRTYEYIGWDWIEYVAQIDEGRFLSVALTDMDCFEGTMPDIILNNMTFQ